LDDLTLDSVLQRRKRMQEVVALFHRFPELSLFVTIFIGTLIGRLHVKGFGLGSVVGSLLAGIGIGVFAKPEYPQLLRWTFFYLFLFSVGFSVGPRFFGGLRKKAIPQIVMAITLALTGLLTTVTVAYVLGFDEGISVGLLSGSLTQSAALGTGLNAIATLPVSDEIKSQLSANAPLGDAITYGFGDLWLILLINVVGPLLMRANLRAEAKALEAQLSGGEETTSPLLAGYRFAFRGYRVENGSIVGIGIGELEDRYAAGRLSVQRLKRNGTLINVTPKARLQAGDQLVIAAQRSVLANAEREIGPEFDDFETLAVPMKTMTVVVTNRSAAGKTLGEMAADRQIARGVYLESLKRGEEEMPHDAGVIVERGDVMRLVGSPQDVERIGKWLGHVEADLARTDLTFIAAGIACGIILGMLHLSINDVPLGLGTAGSILVIGLVAGWARSRYPVFGSVPEAAHRVLADIGLTVFIAIVGLTAGPHAVQAYVQRGGGFFASIFLGGMVVTMVPSLAALVMGRWIFRMNPLMVLAGVTGAQTCMPGLNALREASGSNIGALGYTVPYAIGNILLTVSGPVVVAIMHFLRS
jgi:putative transport protein